MEEEPLVYIVDDDDAVRDSLGLLMKSVGIEHRGFASAIEFLEAYEPGRVACLVSDVRMPGMSGLELQQWLNDRHAELPILFITGHGDVPMAVEAMKSGAVDFIQKPFRGQELLDRVHLALASAADRHAEHVARADIQRRYDELTPRERDVLARVVRGDANKVIALDLGVSQRTVELHRARVMQKMQVRALADLVRLVGRLETEAGHDTAG